MPPTSPPTVFQSEFPTTHWTVVMNTREGSPANQSALEELCRAYWRPLYAFVRRKGVGPHDSQDLVQGFLHRLLERRDLETLT